MRFSKLDLQNYLVLVIGDGNVLSKLSYQISVIPTENFHLRLQSENVKMKNIVQQRFSLLPEKPSTDGFAF